MLINDDFYFLCIAGDECALNCRPMGMRFYATLNKTVVDGTPCMHPLMSTGKAAPPGTRGVCVDGRCKVKSYIKKKFKGQ